MVDPSVNIRNFIFALVKQLDITPGQGECFDDADLIALIHNCPILYDKRLPEYKSEFKKNYFWDAIAEVFGVERQYVTGRWTTLRAYYSKHRNNLEKPHISELTFLDPFVTARNRTSIVEQQPPNLDALIDSVQSRPELYVKKSLVVLQAGEDIDTKIQNSWIEVSTETGSSVQFCQKKWLYLREMYSKTRKQREKGETKHQFVYYERLHFLNEHVATRRIPKGSKAQNYKSEVPDLLHFKVRPVFIDTSQFKPETQQNQSFNAAKDVLIGNNQLKIEQQEEINESFTLSDNESLSSDRNSNNDISGQGSNSITSNTTVKSTSVRRRPEDEDEDDKFGRAIAADLKNIPFSKKKLKLKACIYKLLCEAIDDES